jgi:hypothetical protein
MERLSVITARMRSESILLSARFQIPKHLTKSNGSDEKASDTSETSGALNENPYFNSVLNIHISFLPQVRAEVYHPSIRNPLP